MPIYRTEDIGAYLFGNDVVCPDCLKDKEDEFITGAMSQDEIDNGEVVVVCDRCNKKL